MTDDELLAAKQADHRAVIISVSDDLRDKLVNEIWQSPATRLELQQKLYALAWEANKVGDFPTLKSCHIISGRLSMLSVMQAEREKAKPK